MERVITAYFCVRVLLCWLQSQPGDVPISGFIPVPDMSLRRVCSQGKRRHLGPGLSLLLWRSILHSESCRKWNIRPDLRGETRGSCGPCECGAGLKSPFSSPCIPDLSAAGLNVTCSLVTSDLQVLILLLVCGANALFLLALPSLQWGISIFWS